MAFQESAKLVLERKSTMMFGLNGGKAGALCWKRLNEPADVQGIGPRMPHRHIMFPSIDSVALSGRSWVGSPTQA